MGIGLAEEADLIMLLKISLRAWTIACITGSLVKMYCNLLKAVEPDLITYSLALPNKRGKHYGEPDFHE